MIRVDLQDLFPETLSRGEPEPPAGQGRTLVLLGGCLTGLLLLTAFALLLASRPPSVPSDRVAPPGVTSTQVIPGGSTLATSPAPTAAATPGIPAGATACPARSNGSYAAAVGSPSTSCLFGVAVRDAFVAAKGVEGEQITLDVVSPVTETSSSITCLGHRPIVCLGGLDALVYLY